MRHREKSIHIPRQDGVSIKRSLKYYTTQVSQVPHIDYQTLDTVEHLLTTCFPNHTL